MLHHQVPVAVLNGLRDDRAFDVPPVHAVVFHGPASAAHFRLSEESPDPECALGSVHFDQRIRDLPAVQLVDDILHPAAAVGMETALAVHDETDRYFRVRQGQLLRQLCHMGRLRRRGLQELPPHRRVEKDVPGNDGGAFRRTDLLKGLLHAAVDHIAGPGQRGPGLRDDLSPADGGDAGKGLSPEPQAPDLLQIVCRADLAGGMAKEGVPHIVFRDPAAIVGDADQRLPAFPDLDGDRRRFRVDGILRELLHDGSRPLDDLARGDLIDGIVV